MLGSISQGTGNGLHEILRSMHREQEEALNATTPQVLAAQVVGDPETHSASGKSVSSNMMSRNFASAAREDSKLMAARKAGQEAVTQHVNRQMAILNAGLGECHSLSGKDSENYAIRNLIGKRAARRIMEEGQQTVREESQRNLKEIKEKIEEKTLAAMAPKDENGQPIECLPTNGAGEAPPIPEISGSKPAPAADIAPSTAPSAVPAPAPAVVALPPAPKTHSIDSTV